MPTKEDLIQSLVKKVGLSKRQAIESLSVILDEIIKSLSKGEEIKLMGFGKFLVKKRGERNLPKFKPGQIFKDAVK